MSFTNPGLRLKLRALQGHVRLNGEAVPLHQPMAVGADDLIELEPGARYDLFVDLGNGEGPVAASVNLNSPLQVVTYTPPTYCYIPYYYNGGTQQGNVCTEYGSPAIRL